MKLKLNTTAPIAVETYLNGDIVLGHLEYHPADEFGTPPHFVLVDEVSDDFPILFENGEVIFNNGWLHFEDVTFGEVKFKFAGY